MSVCDILLNPFNDIENVYIIGEYINMQKCDNGANIFFNNSINIYYYNYIINGIKTYCKNKPYIVSENGDILNYTINPIDHTYESFLKKSIQMGDNTALCNLGNLYRMNKKYNDALMCYIKACNVGIKYAYLELGYFYNGDYNGNNKYKNINKMIYYYTAAAHMGIPFGYYLIAEYYKSINNNKKAKYYYLCAANMGCVNSLSALGDYYCHKNNEKSMQYYKMAKDAGYFYE